jgi:hypothetical protein
MRQPSGEQRPQHVGPPGLVVDVTDQRVLDGHTAARGRRVGRGGIEHLRHLPPRVDGHEFVSQPIVGCVQGYRECDPETLRGELADRRHEAHGGHGDRPA